MTEEGSLIRLFPVPFRAIRDEQKFKKWQWISAQIYKAKEDRRPESHKIYIDTILLEDGPLPTTDRWAARRRMLAKLRSEEHTSELQSLMRISYAVFCLKKKT